MEEAAIAISGSMGVWEEKLRRWTCVLSLSIIDLKMYVRGREKLLFEVVFGFIAVAVCCRLTCWPYAAVCVQSVGFVLR